jgi:hypothetical protein
MKKMKTLVSIALAVSSLLVASCDRTKSPHAPGRSASPQESNSFTLTQEVLWTHHWAEMRKIRINGSGIRHITLGKGRGGVDLSEDDVEIVIMAMLDPGANTVTWWVTQHSLRDGEHVSGGGGEPSSFKVSEGDYLQDAMIFADPSGKYEYGEEVRVLDFNVPAREQTITLTVR